MAKLRASRRSSSEQSAIHPSEGSAVRSSPLIERTPSGRSHLPLVVAHAKS
jgi:hypothetical protein